MHWRIAGTYVVSCTCDEQVHWPIDGTMNDTNGACTSVTLFHIDGGYDGEINLSGTDFAIFNFFREKISRGGWRMGLVVDSRADTDQAEAVQRIVLGEDGGPFATTAGVVTEYLGMDRAEVQVRPSGDEKAQGFVGGMRSNFSFEETRNPDGSFIEAGTMWPFGTNYVIGKTRGRSKAFGRFFDSDYGEHGEFDFNDETMGVERGFAKVHGRYRV